MLDKGQEEREKLVGQLRDKIRVERTMLYRRLEDEPADEAAAGPPIRRRADRLSKIFRALSFES